MDTFSSHEIMVYKIHLLNIYYFTFLQLHLPNSIVLKRKT